jgi:hypothetical protein
MVLFQNCVRQSRSPTKMAATVQLRCYWKQLWSRWAITGSWEPLVYRMHWFSMFVCFCFALYLLCCSLFFSSFPSALLYHSFFFFDFHVLFVSFHLHLLIFVCICFHFVSISFDFGYYVGLFLCFLLLSLFSLILLLWKRLIVHYHIQFGLCSVRRPYMNLLNFFVYYHNIAK